MTALTSGDLRQALLVSGEWHAAASLGELEEIAITSLHRLIRCDGVGWNEVDVEQRVVRTSASPVEYFPDPSETLDRLIDQNPIVRYVARTGDQSATMFSDHVSAREFHRLELYADFYREMGVEDQLAVLVDASPLMIGVAFNRSRRTFRERDRALLNLLRPHLVAAYRNLHERAQVERLVALLDESTAGRLLTARQLEVLRLAARGLTDRQIAADLFVSPRTVGKHLEQAYDRLGVRSRAAAVARLLDVP